MKFPALLAALPGGELVGTLTVLSRGATSNGMKWLVEFCGTVKGERVRRVSLVSTQQLHEWTGVETELLEA